VVWISIELEPDMSEGKSIFRRVKEKYSKTTILYVYGVYLWVINQIFFLID